MSKPVKLILIMTGMLLLGLVTGLWIWRGPAILMDFSFVGCM